MRTMVYVKSILAGIVALIIAAMIIAAMSALVLFAESRRSGSTGIGAVSIAISDKIVWLGALLIFAAAFWWEFRRASN